MMFMKKVVIIGGGFAGAFCAKNLDEYFDVVLIDKKDYFEFTPSVLKVIVHPDHLPNIQSPHKAYLKKSKIIIDEVVSITKNRVLTKKGSFSFDYLIITSGSSYASPIKNGLVMADRSKELKESSDRLLNAKTVKIVGGGIVGVELASEIVEAFPDKSIILVHSKQNLMERNNKKSQYLALKFLEKKGVKIILNSVFKTAGLKTDLTFICTGIKPNSQFVKNVNEKNQIIVNEFLQISNNVFAAGDVNSVDEEKTAQNAEEQAKVVVKNIFNLEKNEPLESYTPKDRVMVISLGNKTGIITYKNFAFKGVFAAFLKNFIEWKTMFRYR